MNARCSPSGIVPAHLADQNSDFAGNDGKSGLSMLNLPSTEEAKASTMPGNDSLGPYDDQCRVPIVPDAGQKDPEEPISRAQSWPFLGGTTKNVDLMAQGQILKLEIGP